MNGKAWLLTAVSIAALAGVARAAGQDAQVCQCGAHPPGPPRDRAVAPYAGEPADMSPYSKFAAPYDLNYIHPNIFGKDAQAVAQSAEIQSALATSAAGHPWQLIPVASDQNWGAASTQLVHSLLDEHALAIVALDRDASHLAEQLALKAFIPVIALTGDRALTSTTPAAAIALLRDAGAHSGPNPQRLRDVLASGAEIQGVAFLPTGEPRPR